MRTFRHLLEVGAYEGVQFSLLDFFLITITFYFSLVGFNAKANYNFTCRF